LEHEGKDDRQIMFRKPLLPFGMVKITSIRTKMFWKYFIIKINEADN
jgi:hypothetical protein